MALVNSGSKYSFIYERALPLDAEAITITGMMTCSLDQTTLINQMLKLEDIVMLEFGASLHVLRIKCTRPYEMCCIDPESSRTAYYITTGRTVSRQCTVLD